MNSRELSPGEWKTFFDAFSRRFQGVPVTVEPASGPAESIAIMAGDAPGENVVHVVRQPRRVTVAQVTNGEDDLLIIDAVDGPATRIDFRAAKARATAHFV